MTDTARLEIGDKAPAFSLPDAEGKTVKLSDFKGRKVIVYFYPAAMTPGCTKQACGLRDASRTLKNRGVKVYGISADSPERHQKFIEKEKLNFPLLSDEDHAMMEKYGAWGEKSMYGKKFMGIKRISYLLDPAGTVRHAWAKVKTAEHADEVLKKFDELAKAKA